MTRATGSTELTQPLIKHRVVTEPSWLWLVLVGGSIAIHLVLATIALPIATRLSLKGQQAQESAYTPIDFVDAGSDTSASPSQTQAVKGSSAAAQSTQLQSAANADRSGGSESSQRTASQTDASKSDASQSDTSQSDTSQSNIHLAPAIATPAASTSAISVPEVTSKPVPSARPRQPASTPAPRLNPLAALPRLAPTPPLPTPASPPVLRRPETPVPQTSPAATQTATGSTPGEAASASRPSPLPSIATAPIDQPIPDRSNPDHQDLNPASLDRSSLNPASTPSPPSVATLPINVPVPDVSETLVTPTETTTPSPSQVAVNADIAPARLTAKLAIEPMPSPTANGLEAIAHPKNGADAQILSDQTHSACLSSVTPEAAQFLGKTVAIQVATDATGQVTETTVRQSSQNPDYDSLAECVVRHWTFEPARAKERPVASDALVVLVVIERG